MRQKNQKSQKSHSPNYRLITVFAVISIFGLIMLASASQIIGMDKFRDSYYYLKHQLFFGILPGLALLIIFARINYKTWEKIAMPIFIFSIILLILVFIPQLSYGHGGANRWLHTGLFSIQPSEIAKLGFIIFLAAWFKQKKEDIQNFHYTFLPFLMYLCIMTILIALEPDIGTLSVIIITALAIYWVANAKFIHIISLILICLLIFFVLIKAAPYRMARITTFINPQYDTQYTSYQINQSILAIGAGGWFGQGFGLSKQKYQYLPEAAGDSIFAIIAEELGFVFTSLFVLLYIYFIIMMFQIARKSFDGFGKFTAVGIAVWLAYQGLINMGAMVKIMPLTGLPLPFVSYGGSAMIVSMVAIGILINVSKYTKP